VNTNKKENSILKSSSRLFITTIMMVVLLVVGLSTATFAWFSSNIEVRSNELTFTAKNVAGANIYITWDNPEEMNWDEVDKSTMRAIQFADPEEILPMVPKNAPTDTTTVSQFKDSFYGATTNVQENENDPLIFNTGGMLKSPYLGNNGAATPQEYFYIINGDATSTSVSTLVTFKGDNMSLLRVALFVDDVFKGIVVTNNIDPTTADTHYGEIVYGEDATTNGFNKISHDATEPISFTIPGIGAGQKNYVKVAIVCWYDGVWLDESGQSKTASISLVFRADSTGNNG